MSSNVFRHRGLKVAVDTTEMAEFDIRELTLSDALVENIGRRLRDMAFSKQDRVVGDVRVREMFGYDVAFIVGRQNGTVVITIGAVEVPSPTDPMEVVLARLDLVAMFRGVTGL
ncbi:MAG: hypothetical protein AAGH83_09685 [Pseudomonadota bacterium]